MPLRITCPECSTTYNVGENLRGKSIRCRKCQAVLTIAAAKDEIEIIEEPTPARKASPPAKGSTKAKPPRRDDDSDDETPRKRAGKPQKKGSSALVIGGIAAAGILVAGAILIYVFVSSSNPPTVVQASPPPSAPPPGFASSAPPPMTPTAGPANTPPATNPNNATPETPAPAPTPGPEIPGGGGGGGGRQVFPYLLKSSTWILVLQQRGNMIGVSGGTGSLIDRENRLILTNYHVVRGGNDYAVFFPAYDKGGQVISSREEYMRNLKENEIDKKGKENGIVMQGRVVAQDQRRDLALIQIERLPDNVEPLQIATRSPQVGDTVHSLGNPGGSGALWVYTSGTVRAVYKKRWKAGSEGKSPELDLEAQVVETQSPTNPGDSGGPLVNDRGELVAVTQGGASGGQLLSTFIDQSEARNFIEQYFNRSGGNWVRSKRPLLTPVGSGPTTASIPELVSRLRSPDARVRAEGAQRLGESGAGGKVALPSLVRLLRDEDDLVRRMAQEALRLLGAPARDDVAGVLVPALEDPSPEVRVYLLDMMARMGPEAMDGLPAVLKSAEAQEPRVRVAAIRAAAKVGSRDRGRINGTLDKALQDGDKAVRIAAAEVLATDLPLGGSDMPRLQALLKASDAELQSAGARALSRLGPSGKEALPALTAALKVEGVAPATRMSYLQAMAAIGAEPSVVLPELQKALQGNDTAVRIQAIEAVGKLGAAGAPAVPAMAKLLEDLETRKPVVAALTLIGPPAAKDGAVPLLRFLDDQEARQELLAALLAMKPTGTESKAVIGRLIEVFGDEKRLAVRAKAAEVLAKIGKPSVQPLGQALLSQNPLTRLGAANALTQMGSEAKPVLPTLVRVYQAEPIMEVRAELEKAAQKIQGK